MQVCGEGSEDSNTLDEMSALSFTMKRIPLICGMSPGVSHRRQNTIQNPGPPNPRPYATLSDSPSPAHVHIIITIAFPGSHGTLPLLA